jgi:hypothetical protein
MGIFDCADDDADIDGSLGAIEPLSNNDWLTLTSETLRNLTSGPRPHMSARISLPTHHSINKAINLLRWP